MKESNNKVPIQDKNLASADAFASEYDSVVPTNGWCAPAVIFELMAKHVRSEERILDLSIGTGFQNAGLEIYGVDGSSEMLKMCASKSIAAELRRIDLNGESLPFVDEFFHHGQKPPGCSGLCLIGKDRFGGNSLYTLHPFQNILDSRFVVDPNVA